MASILVFLEPVNMKSRWAENPSVGSHASLRRGRRLMLCAGVSCWDGPTLVLWGEVDPILPIAWADRLPEYFPQLTFKRIPAVGHFMMREAPELVVKEVLDFLAPCR